MEQNHTITMVEMELKEYEKLKKDQRELQALHAGGVDNWEWYEESLEDFWKEEEV